MNLAWTTFVPLPSLISIPLQVTVGEPATYNVIATPMLPLAAFAAFLLCRRVTGAFWPSVLGGYIFGFSSYMLGQVLGHLVLIVIFPVPLIGLIDFKRLDNEISARRFAILLAALPVTQFLCSVDLFATLTLVCGFSLLLALVYFGGDAHPAPTPDHSHHRRILDFDGHTLTLFLLLARLRISERVIWPPSRYSADLIGFLVPRQTILWGSAVFATAITDRFTGTILENGDYLGVVLIVFVEIFRRRFWPTAGRQVSHDFVSCDHHRRHRPDSAHRWSAGVSDALGHLPTPSAYRKYSAGSLHDVRVSDRGDDDGDVVRHVGRASGSRNAWRPP